MSFSTRLLIFGHGPFPALGVAGAAWASIISQWAGAMVLMRLLHRDMGPFFGLQFSGAAKLLRIGQDLFIRTGSITFFLLLATRAATQLGAADGAAHQAIRQVWMLSALFLDAFAVTGQSLVAFFAGSRRVAEARQVARLVCLWSLGTGSALSLLMWLGRPLVIRLFVPAAAVLPFGPAWAVTLATQPVNALAFATDGIHWGTGDFRFLRNVVLMATSLGGALMLSLPQWSGFSLVWIWALTGLWIIIRAAAGVLRIWPGIGRAPFLG